MKTRPFVHLHMHTGYSLLDGAARIPDIMDYALETGMPAVAITDHGVMYGVIDFYQTALKKGIKPIIGCEMYITKDRHERGEAGRVPFNHLVLLAESDEGYSNLTRLVSKAHMEGFYYKPRIDLELLSEYSSGLIGLSACLQGQVASFLRNDDTKSAEQSVNTYMDILGKKNFFLEIQDHGIPEQRKVNEYLKKITQTTGAPLVATNDVHYLKKEHAAAHEVLLCLQTQAVMSDSNRMRYSTNEFYMKTGREMEGLFKEFPGSLDLTLEIADRCNAAIEFDVLHFPTYKVPTGISQKQYLTKLAYDGMESRYGLKDPENPGNAEEKTIIERFKHEMGVIENAGFINYFLVVWDFVHFAQKQGIPVGPGRGSGGGSMVAYLLGITSIDPLRYGLIFERFLNPERVSPPDFDIDFCQSRRGEVIEYVKEKYGREQCAQIITFGTLGPKTVIRDIGRALEIPYSYCDRLSKMVPEDPKIKTLNDALGTSPDFKKAYKSEPDCKRILDYGFVLEGLQRNQGTHAAGVVIGEKALPEIIPLCRDKEGEPVTQYTMEPLGDIGLLKMDFLGLKTLTVLKEAVELVKETTGREIDLDNIEFDDGPTYDLLNRGDTIGVFQLESGGMRDLIRRVGIDRIEDLIAMIALYRPGPMNMLEGYVNRKHGKEKIVYQHPLMEDILKETYGVMVYQEQVQKVANVLANYSLGEADILRRAMGKKKAEVMAKERSKFVDGCVNNNIDKKTAEQIFDNMAEFAGYGFNKSHSAGYAIISYQTAFLKANHPAEFMSALISSEMGNADKLPVFIAEAQVMDIEILPPDVNHSKVRFSPDDNTIRYGLAGIKNVGRGACEAVVKEREENGPFRDLVEFCERIDGHVLNKKAIESLARCGAFDSSGAHRAQVFNGIEFAMARSQEKARDKQSGQGNLFDLMGEDTADAMNETLPECAPWPENQLLSAEKELLGIYMSGHPLTQYEHLLKTYQLSDVNGLSQLEDRSGTRIGGIIASLNKRLTRQKKNMAILRLEDLDGAVEVLVWPDTYDKFSMHLEEEAAVLICGEALTSEDTPKLAAQEIYPLADAPRHFAKQLRIHVPAAHTQNGMLDKLKEVLRLHPGSTPVVVCLMMPAGEKVFINTNKSFRVFPDQELIKEVEHLLGEETAYVAVDKTPCKNPPKPRRWEKKKRD